MKTFAIRFNELKQSLKEWVKKWTRKDDDDWFDHPYAIF